MKNKYTIFAALVIMLGLVFTGCSPATGDSGEGTGAAGGDKTVQGDVGASEDTGSTGATGSAGGTRSGDGRDVRTDRGEGGVQVTAALLSPEYLREADTGNYDPEKNIVIEISMGTHMGDLREYPIMQNAELTVNAASIKPIKWEVINDDSHHLSGWLVFEVNDEKTANSGELHLNLKDLRGVPERGFSWEDINY